MACAGGHIVRIRIYGIIGFSGFCHLVFGWQTLIRTRLGWIAAYGEKRNPGESEILKNPANPVNLDSDKSRAAARRLWRKSEFGRTRNPENPENPANPAYGEGARSPPRTVKSAKYMPQRL